MPFDEEELDPHGECRAEIERLVNRIIDAEFAATEAEAKVGRLRAALVRAYQFVSPHSDPLPITNGQMAKVGNCEARILASNR